MMCENDELGLVVEYNLYESLFISAPSARTNLSAYYQTLSFIFYLLSWILGLGTWTLLSRLTEGLIRMQLQQGQSGKLLSFLQNLPYAHLPIKNSTITTHRYESPMSSLRKTCQPPLNPFQNSEKKRLVIPFFSVNDIRIVL